MTMDEHRIQTQQRLRNDTGIDEAMIDRVVRSFYAKAREDALLGPVFGSRITDWEPHLRTISDFWSSVLLMTGVYHGRPMAKHIGLPIDAAHFDRWLALFRETATELCPPVAAARFIEMAQRVGESLELGIASANGQILKKGERLTAAR
jgi:hemoglobin